MRNKICCLSGKGPDLSHGRDIQGVKVSGGSVRDAWVMGRKGRVRCWAGRQGTVKIEATGGQCLESSGENI